VHHVDEARRVAAEEGVDYLMFGAVFETASKPGITPAGLDALRAVVAAVPVPVLAVGGITLGRMREVASAGAAGAAAIGLFAEGGQQGPERLQTIVAQASLAFDTPRGLP
jgi:thiamine monophosphate synthase